MQSWASIYILLRECNFLIHSISVSIKKVLVQTKITLAILKHRDLILGVKAWAVVEHVGIAPGIFWELWSLSQSGQ